KLPTIPGVNFHHRVDYFSFGPEKLLKDAEIFHTSSYDLAKPKHAKLVLTVHDVIHKVYPAAHSKETIENIDRMLKAILPQTSMIITDSQTTKDDFLKWFFFKPDKIKVVYPGVSGWFCPQEGQEKEPYLLFVGTIEPRKNIKNLIRAFYLLKKEHFLPHKLIIIGMKGWMFEDVFKLVEELKMGQEIIFKDYVPFEELRFWYSGAEVFIYPSLYEGFGFPIVEAFACGTPVVTSNTSSCAEIGRGAALLVDPQNFGDLSSAILRIIKNTDLKNEMVAKGLDRARQFSWAKTANGILSIFNQVYTNES
ncbi:MAG: glycosyltransferase family 1 protein, partial [Candidatus Omnitrophota bacterium]|nr:glycosyltransferase family 1 protein [Candidatus Omnitrophota bacterium]